MMGSVPDVSVYYDKYMYDRVISEYFDHSDFHNFGIWNDASDTAAQASRNLMKQLVALAPELPNRILEVGCGKGATTRELRKYWPNANITAIDISEEQLVTCRNNCPTANFILMDACDMNLESKHFDLIISVEAAFHFRSRYEFLKQARKLLAPSGRLVMQDVLYKKENELAIAAHDSDPDFLNPIALLPKVNYLAGPTEYQALLYEAGFERNHILDVTEIGPKQFYKHFLNQLFDPTRWAAYDSDLIRLRRVGARLFARQLSYCLLVQADLY